MKRTLRSKAVVQKYEEEKKKALDSLYDGQSGDVIHHRPVMYKNSIEARKAIQKLIIKEKKRILTSGKDPDKNFSIGRLANILVKNWAMTYISTKGLKDASLVIYDYDSHRYEAYTHPYINQFVYWTYGESTTNMIKNLSLTLEAKKDETAIYNPLPSYKLAVGNGIFNTLTGELEEDSPYYTVMTKIETDYIKNKKAPVFSDGFTFEKMMNNFANHNPERLKLLKEICVSIISGKAPSAAFYVILGNGGDGKSTFFTLLSNVIGVENVAYVNFSDLNSDDKLTNIFNCKMIVGMDNDASIYIKAVARLKSISAHEPVTISRKYQNSFTAPVPGTFVQLCNSLPRFAEGGTSMRRRLVIFKAEHSYHEEGTENTNISDTYIYQNDLLEYVLSTILERFNFTNDVNDVDVSTASDALDADDTTQQFVQYLWETDILSPVNDVIPFNLLYVIYGDWYKREVPGSKPLNSRSFKLKIDPILVQYGYVVAKTSNRRSVQTLEKYDQLWLSSMPEEVLAGEGYSDFISLSLTTPQNRVYNYHRKADLYDKSKPISQLLIGTPRRDFAVTAEEYFGLKEEFDKYDSVKEYTKDGAVREEYSNQYPEGIQRLYANDLRLALIEKKKRKCNDFIKVLSDAVKHDYLYKEELNQLALAMLQQSTMHFSVKAGRSVFADIQNVKNLPFDSDEMTKELIKITNKLIEQMFS